MKEEHGLIFIILAVLRLKAMNVEREPVVVRSRYIENKKRAKSMH